jgi:hypothetical protein
MIDIHAVVFKIGRCRNIAYDRLSVESLEIIIYSSFHNYIYFLNVCDRRRE